MSESIAFECPCGDEVWKVELRNVNGTGSVNASLNVNRFFWGNFVYISGEWVFHSSTEPLMMDDIQLLAGLLKEKFDVKLERFRD